MWESEPEASQTRAALVYGVRFTRDELASGAASLKAIRALQTDSVVVLECADTVFADPDDMWHTALVVGVPILVSYGGAEQANGMSWQELREGVASAERAAAAIEPKLRPHVLGDLASGLYMASAGPLCTSFLVKGRWDPNLEVGDDESVGLVRAHAGTDGTSQEASTHGGCRGICVLEGGYEYGLECERLVLDEAADSELDAALAAAGIGPARYHLIVAYD